MQLNKILLCCNCRTVERILTCEMAVNHGLQYTWVSLWHGFFVYVSTYGHSK